MKIDDETQKLLNKSVEIEKNQASNREILAKRAAPVNILVEALIGSLGEGAENWKPAEAKAEVLKKLYDIKAANSLNAYDNYENFMQIVTLIVENSEIDFRMTPFLMEKKRNEIAQAREWRWRDWRQKDWNMLCDEFDKTGSVKIPLLGLGTLEPMAFNVETGEPSRRNSLHIPNRASPGEVFTTSKEDHSFLEGMKKDFATNPDYKNSRINVTPGEGAYWQLLIYQTNQTLHENITNWVRERLANQAKLYGGLPKYVFLETPHGKVILKGLGGEAFTPGYKITLTREARREFGEELDDDTVKEIKDKHKQPEQTPQPIMDNAKIAPVQSSEPEEAKPEGSFSKFKRMIFN